MLRFFRIYVKNDKQVTNTRANRSNGNHAENHVYTAILHIFYHCVLQRSHVFLKI